MTSARDKHAASVIDHLDELGDLAGDVRVLAHAMLGLVVATPSLENDGYALSGRALAIADKIEAAADRLVPVPPSD